MCVYDARVMKKMLLYTHLHPNLSRYIARATINATTFIFRCLIPTRPSTIHSCECAIVRCADTCTTHLQAHGDCVVIVCYVGSITLPVPHHVPSNRVAADT